MDYDWLIRRLLANAAAIVIALWLIRLVTGQ